MGYDALSPMLYTYNKDQDGTIQSVQSMTLLGNGRTDSIFKKNVPGMWFTQQSDEVMDILFKCYNEEPYPTEELLTDIVKRVNAPGVAQMLAEQMLMDALIRHASIRTMAIPPSIYVGKTNQEFVLQIKTFFDNMHLKEQTGYL